MRALPKPIIASLNGTVAGAGACIALVAFAVGTGDLALLGLAVPLLLVAVPAMANGIAGQFDFTLLTVHSWYGDANFNETHDIVYTYDMLLEETRISVSLATVEFTSAGDGGGQVIAESGVVVLAAAAGPPPLGL